MSLGLNVLTEPQEHGGWTTFHGKCPMYDLDTIDLLSLQFMYECSDIWTNATVYLRQKPTIFTWKGNKANLRDLKAATAYSLETPNLSQNRWCFVPCDLEIWWMTLENNRASLLSCFKLCATFHSHPWIQTGVTVRKRPIWVKFEDF